MAKCDEGYLCDVCGGDVASLVESDLYLRYVIGMLDPEVLHTAPERHIRCNPTLAQFIDHPEFPPAVAEGEFQKQRLDPEFVRQRSELVTRGWLRLQEMAASSAAIIEYPLPEARRRYQG